MTTPIAIVIGVVCGIAIWHVVVKHLVHRAIARRIVSRW